MVNSGTYKFVNVKGGTTLDLSGGDNRSIIGYTANGQPNQHWRIETSDGENCMIQSVSSGLFISIDGNPGDGVPLIATQNQQRWSIVQDERDRSVYRFFWPGTDYNFDLEDHGNPTPGTKVQLWSQTPGKGQTWHIENV